MTDTEMLEWLSKNVTKIGGRNFEAVQEYGRSWEGHYESFSFCGGDFRRAINSMAHEQSMRDRVQSEGSKGRFRPSAYEVLKAGQS